jgi:uncharacterized protein (TIGR02646 family)
MRHVDLNSVQRPPGWDERAQRASQDVNGLPDAERHGAIKERRAIWSDLKLSLEQVSAKKCWYCESREVRSDKHVDHFRPKNRVGEGGCEKHPGYWWLAFDWKNFRYCCAFCNSSREDLATGNVGGKADRFPLRDEGRRCWQSTQPLSEEQPTLLDPTVEGDPALLWFDEDGMTRPSYSEEEAAWPHIRAKESIAVYHLNHTDLKEARLAVCTQCKRLIAEGDEAWREYTQGAGVAQDRFRRIVVQLKDLLSRNAEYSATARCTVMGLRSSNRPWLDSVLRD